MAARRKGKAGKASPPRKRPVADVNRLDLAMRALNESVYDWDIAHNRFTPSRSMTRILGLPAKRLGLKAWQKAIHPEDYPGFRSATVEHLKGRSKRFEYDYRYRDRNGKWRWARTHGVAIRDKQGRAVRMVGSTGDITEIKRVEQALKDSEERYALATQAATEGIYAWNLESGALFLSDRSKAFFAIKDDALTPATWNKRVHKQDYPGYRQAIVDYFKGHGKTFEREYRIRNASGGYSWVVDRGVAVRNAEGRVTRLVGALTDVTQRKLHELDLQRARDEATAALERQTATAEILKVIAKSPSDVQPVFDAIVENARKLLNGFSAMVTRRVGDALELAAFTSTGRGGDAAIKEAYPQPVSGLSYLNRALLSRRPVFIEDIEADRRVDPKLRVFGVRRGWRSALTVPLIGEGEALGTLSVSRQKAGPFTDHEISLLQTFASQAVIAIENVRLFNETREALERQTATAEILGVIAGSPTDTKPVFDAIASCGARLLAGVNAAILLRKGSQVEVVGLSESLKEENLPGRVRMLPLDREKNFPSQVILDAKVLHIPDWESSDILEFERNVAKAYGVKACLQVPLLRKGEGIGVIVVSRTTAGPFPEKDIALLRSFADQAVIAIENVRLFNETKEALERQTATAEILNVIASSPSDVQPVFDAIAASARRLLDANAALVARRAGDTLELAAYTSTGEAADAELRKLFPAKITGQGHLGKAVLSGEPVGISDILNDERYSEAFRASVRARGLRSLVSVPMMREGEAIGVISVNRTVPGNFSDHQTNLLKTFADQAVIAIENVRLFNETKEALERQTATGEVLAAMSGSMTDTQPVFEKIVQSLRRLFGTRFTVLQLLRDGMVEMPAVDGVGIERLRERYPRPLDETTVGGRAMLTKQAVQFAPVLDNPATPPATIQFAKDFGFDSVIFTPMIHEGRVVGAIGAAHTGAKPFDERQIALIKTFAAQAVIAIENVRLFNETKESLERQTATAEILKVIASSPSDVQPVFDAILDNACKLCDSQLAAAYRFDGTLLHLVATQNWPAEALARVASRYPASPDPRSTVGRVVLTGKVECQEDTLADPTYDHATAHVGGWRRMLGVPLLREGVTIGVIVVTWREPGPIAERLVFLLKTFADQAVIAIENVRLFNETKEALERQTATAEVLNVISSSPTDVQPVFDAIARSGKRLCNARECGVFRFDGELIHLVALAETESAWANTLRGAFPSAPSNASITSRAILARSVVQIPDILADPEYELRGAARDNGPRSVLSVPLVREGQVVGAITVDRSEPGAFLDKQVALLQTFADQAVIAIENVRLFNETKEALEQQTASAEILQVISSSPTDVQPVFDTIVASAKRLLGGHSAAVLRVDGEEIRLAACTKTSPEADEELRRFYPRPLAAGPLSVAARERRPVVVADTETAFDYSAEAKALARRRGYRSQLVVPMLRDEQATGLINVTRANPGPFSEKEMALLQTFASQAVIAIENVRLFKELQEREVALTKSVGQLTALGEVGRAISSTLELETVLQTIVTRAVQLAGLDGGSIYEYDEATEQFQLQAAENMDATLVEAVRRTPIRKGDGVTGRTAVTHEPVQIPDIQDDSYQGSRKDILLRAGYRAILAVPLLREDHVVGALMVNRKAPGEFAPEIVELLKTFATQSAMAIQNARLFREIAEKGKQLEEASRHKSNFLASMSHELRTPLNAILGFNEMILGQVYGEVPADMQEPLADIQTSGKHLLRLINNVLDLAKIEAGRMELALSDYSVQDTVDSVHSTLRPLAAEKGLEFLANVPNDLPLAYGDGGRIAQCLMNLAGNSLKFTKAGRVEISVQTNNGLLVYKVEDTGIGIPPDKIGGLFTEFKQTDATIASEYGGTGLGLSISRKFVEMHGGRIWVESELGKGSAFIFEIPLRVNS